MFKNTWTVCRPVMNNCWLHEELASFENARETTIIFLKPRNSSYIPGSVLWKVLKMVHLGL